MRRGLLNWSQKDEPVAVFDARLGRCRDAMQEAGMDALLVYTNFPRPAAVSYLTHFVPYWNQSLLVVLPEGLPTLMAGLSKRVSGWIMETAHLGEVICTPNIGRDVASLLVDKLNGAGRIGVVERAKIPAPLLGQLAQNGGYEIVDASQLFASIRHPADASEIAMSRRAAEIARAALSAGEFGTAGANRSNLTAVEAEARQAGAEEVLIDVCEDLAADASFRRAQGDITFADRFAIRVSVALNGYWVRVGESYARGNGNETSAAVAAVIAECLPRLGDGGNGGEAANAAEGFDVKVICLEGSGGGTPLVALNPVPAGAIVSAGLLLRVDNAPWLIAEPVRLSSEPGEPAERLLAP